jgi:Domain of unknown function (DUF4123)
MSTKSHISLAKALWPAGMSSRIAVYAILDGARDDMVYATVQASYLEHSCLYAGDLPKELMITAPYLVRLEEGNSWTQTILKRAWSNSWGIFLRTETSMTRLRRHLRTFLKVRDTRGRSLLFRYYDPRVMRVYLPTCTPSELETVFGPIDRFLMEDSLPENLLDFSREDGQLVLSTTQIMGVREAVV